MLSEGEISTLFEYKEDAEILPSVKVLKADREYYVRMMMSHSGVWWDVRYAEQQRRFREGHHEYHSLCDMIHRQRVELARLNEQVRGTASTTKAEG